MSRRSRKPLTRSGRLAKQLSVNELAFKDRLRDERVAAGLSQRQLAAKLGVAPSTISRMEHDDADLTLSQIRHYAYGIGREVKFIVDEFEAEQQVVHNPDTGTHYARITFTKTVSTLVSSDFYMDGFHDGWKGALEFAEQSDEALSNA